MCFHFPPPELLLLLMVPIVCPYGEWHKVQIMYSFSEFYVNCCNKDLNLKKVFLFMALNIFPNILPKSFKEPYEFEIFLCYRNVNCGFGLAPDYFKWLTFGPHFFQLAPSIFLCRGQVATKCLAQNRGLVNNCNLGIPVN